jgi:hypothetical protein
LKTKKAEAHTAQDDELSLFLLEAMGIQATTNRSSPRLALSLSPAQRESARVVVSLGDGQEGSRQGKSSHPAVGIVHLVEEKVFM